ncbi:Translation initiation factor eIF-2B subunit beta [Chamberlinius hualienensis]
MANSNSLENRTRQFMNDLRQRTDISSYTIARTVVCLLRDTISFNDWNVAKDLIEIIRQYGVKLMTAEPTEWIVGNMVKRVLKIIRVDYEELQFGKDASDIEREKHDYSNHFDNLKDTIMNSIADLLEELDQSIDSIAGESLNHIHANMIVMTYGRSNTVEQFLKAAAKDRKFEVYVAECAPSCHGQEMAMNLAKDKIKTTVIADFAVFAIMSRINKVIIGTDTVLANGGLRAVSGSHKLALAAKYYSVPLIVCAPQYKLSPEYFCSGKQSGFNRYLSPQSVFQSDEDNFMFNFCSEQKLPLNRTISEPWMSKVQVYNPAFDYVPPELITLFIFNIGGNAPSYLNRLISELYHPDDSDINLTGSE